MNWGTLDTRGLFTLLIAVVGILRLGEVLRSQRNARRLLARGGVERGAEHYPAMVLLHGTFFAALTAELWLLRPGFHASIAVVSTAVFVASFALRWWAIRTLGDAWTTRVIRVADDPLVTTGPYRFLSHPNYLGVAGELLALPLIHGCWRTALVFSLLDAGLLRHRIRGEERLLREGHPEP